MTTGTDTSKRQILEKAAPKNLVTSRFGDMCLDSQFHFLSALGLPRILAHQWCLY